jgi:hypothetical protein
MEGRWGGEAQGVADPKKPAGAVSRGSVRKDIFSNFIDIVTVGNSDVDIVMVGNSDVDIVTVGNSDVDIGSQRQKQLERLYLYLEGPH